MIDIIYNLFIHMTCIVVVLATNTYNQQFAETRMLESITSLCYEGWQNGPSDFKTLFAETVRMIIR